MSRGLFEFSDWRSTLYRMRSRIQWSQLAKEFRDDSSVHRTFWRWVELEVLERISAALVD